MAGKKPPKSLLSILWKSVYKSDQYKKFKAAVRKRDGYTCNVCGCKSSRKNRLHVHHIARKCQHLDKIFDTANATLLCQKHHIEEHKRMHKEGVDSEVPHVSESVLAKFVETLSFSYYSKKRRYNNRKRRQRVKH